MYINYAIRGDLLRTFGNIAGTTTGREDKDADS